MDKNARRDSTFFTSGNVKWFFILASRLLFPFEYQVVDGDVQIFPGIYCASLHFPTTAWPRFWDHIEIDGLKAIATIILGGNIAEPSTVESDPVLMLCQYLTWCSTHSIARALWIVVRILNNTSIMLPAKLEAATQKRLDRLLAETAYDDGIPYLPFEEKLEIRRIAAILAGKLWTHYRSCNASVPHAVEKWRELCQSPDEFAEIRNAWAACEATQ